jgi:phosphatidylglycerol:prolipoprotein diacylglycerol transferase
LSPVLGVFAGYPVYLFPILLNAGVFAGLGLAAVLARRRGVAAGALLDAAVWVLPAGLVGARLVYVAVHWWEYAADPLAVFSIWEGGLSLLGAITAGLLVAPLALRRQGLPIGVGLDAAVVGLAFGQAIGRLGCLGAGCATGLTVPPGTAWPALDLPDATGLFASRFPSPLVESGADLVLGVFLLWLWTRRRPPGTVAAAYLIGFGLLRALAEVLRSDATPLGPLALGQWWGALAAAAGVAVLVRRAPLRRRARGARAPTYARDA